MNRLKIIILFFTLSISTFLKSQAIDAPHSFVVVGFTANMGNLGKLTTFGGYSPTDNSYIARVLPTFTVNKYISLTPGYAFFQDYESKSENAEHQIMAYATFTLPISNKLSITDRNMYYYQIKNYASNTATYRNRLGLNYKIKVKDIPVSLYAHDEIYINLENGKLRNRVYVGSSVSLSWLTPQLMYYMQSEKGKTNKHYWMLSLIVPLEKFGFFSGKKK